MICTTAPNVYLVTAANGAQTCQDRYVDNGDGTVTDNKTGLMWEKKTVAGTGGVHDVSTLYTWSAVSPFLDPSGTLYTDFLAQLNGTTCFAGYCDWRIPKAGELRSILLPEDPNCTSNPCIDLLVFGPTQAYYYWSSSSKAGDPFSVWYVLFTNGSLGNIGKASANFHARAVRGGR